LSHYCHFCSIHLTSCTHSFTLSLHDALPISLHQLLAKHPIGTVNWFLPPQNTAARDGQGRLTAFPYMLDVPVMFYNVAALEKARSEEHTFELQSRGHLVCRLLLETKQNNQNY